MELIEIIKMDLNELLETNLDSFDKLFIKNKLKEIEKQKFNLEEILSFYKSKKFFYIFNEPELRNKIADIDLLEILNSIINKKDIDYSNMFNVLNLLNPDKLNNNIKEELYKVCKSNQEYTYLINSYFKEFKEFEELLNINAFNIKTEKNKYNLNNNN